MTMSAQDEKLIKAWVRDGAFMAFKEAMEDHVAACPHGQRFGRFKAWMIGVGAGATAVGTVAGYLLSRLSPLTPCFAIVCLLLGGCGFGARTAPMAGPAQGVAPAATSEAPVTAETIETLTQTVTQLQKTISTQTTTHSLDAERAKVMLAQVTARADADARHAETLLETVKQGSRKSERSMLVIVGLLFSLVVAMAVARSIVSARHRLLGYVVAIAIAAVSIGAAWIWPW